MTRLFLRIAALALLAGAATAQVKVDDDAFGESLGGWKKRDNRAAEYPLSGSIYRTYKPEITPTPEGGIFVSVRIDHVRGWLSSDDHAMLEITVSPQGMITAAKSNIAIQGLSITSDLILGANEAGKQLTGADLAVQIGTDLVADLTAKLTREKLVEAGRVSFPAALRHNYNLLYQSLRVDGAPVQPLLPVRLPDKPGTPPNGTPVPADTSTSPPAAAAPPSPPPAASEPAATPAEPPPVAKPVPGNATLDIQPFAPPASVEIPAGQ